MRRALRVTQPGCMKVADPPSSSQPGARRPRGAGWSYGDAWPEVGKIRGMVSLEPDKVEVYLDNTRMRPEPGQTVIAHGIEASLGPGEMGHGGRP